MKGIIENVISLLNEKDDALLIYLLRGKISQVNDNFSFTYTDKQYNRAFQEILKVITSEINVFESEEKDLLEKEMWLCEDCKPLLEKDLGCCKLHRIKFDSLIEKYSLITNKVINENEELIELKVLLIEMKKKLLKYNNHDASKHQVNVLNVVSNA